MCDIRSGKSYLNEVSHLLLKLVLTNPTIFATAEKAFLFLQHLKTFLRSSMTQTRLNHLVLLHIYKERSESLVHVLKEFMSINEYPTMGKFTIVLQRFRIHSDNSQFTTRYYLYLSHSRAEFKDHKITSMYVQPAFLSCLIR